MNLTSKIIEDKVARQIQDEIDQEILHELSELSIAVKPKRLEPRDLRALDLKPGELYPSADGLAIVIRVWETTAPNSKHGVAIFRHWDILWNGEILKDYVTAIWHENVSVSVI